LGGRLIPRRSAAFAPRSPAAHATELAALRHRIRAGEVCLVVVRRLAAFDRNPARVMALLRECEEWDVRVLVLEGPLQHLPMRWLLAHLGQQLEEGLEVGG
jgi:hypothetical protein